MKWIIHFFVFTLFCACAKNDKTTLKEKELIQVLPTQSFYRAILRPLNNHLSGYLPTGLAEIEIEGEAISIVTLLDDDASARHFQAIHLQGNCPEETDDLNQDGIVDFKEALKITGEIFFHLDGVIDLERDEEFPVGKNFTYKKEVSLKDFADQLWKEKEENLIFDEKTILILGTHSNTELPESVFKMKGLSSQESVPVACGVLKRSPKKSHSRFDHE